MLALLLMVRFPDGRYAFRLMPLEGAAATVRQGEATTQECCRRGCPRKGSARGRCLARRIIASGTHCTSLIYLTDVPGIRDENGRVVDDIDEAGIMDMRSRGILSGGMLPKTSSCLEALKAGVGSVWILPGASPDILLKFADGSLTEGTKIHGYI